MKFVFLFLGKTKEKYLRQGIIDYADRLGRFVKTDIVVLKEKPARDGSDVSTRRLDAEVLLANSSPASYVVALDPTGSRPDSEELAGMLGNWEGRGLQKVYFLIGGHLGLHQSVLERADLVLSLSKLTFTHEMTRMILLEQLYRACTIKAGHKYHK